MTGRKVKRASPQLGVKNGTNLSANQSSAQKRKKLRDLDSYLRE